MSDDPLDAFEDALFRAARRERTQSAALERTAKAVVASYRQQRSRRAWLTLGSAVALAASAVLILRSGPHPEDIEAERLAPKQSFSRVAAAPAASGQSGPTLAASVEASDDAGATPLRSGLAPSVAATTLEEERAMLEHARSELNIGNSTSALTLLDQYDKVSGGHLSAEATLLRIQALSASGRTSLAAKLAQRFVDSDPNSPLAYRARGYIPKPSPREPSARAAAEKKP